MAELACVIALQPHVLLLDEPTAGYTQRETEAFGVTIGDVRRHLGATIVIIDHDVRLMRSLVDRLYVLAAGKVIAEGPPSILDSDTRVAEVYLGAAVAARTAAPTLDPAAGSDPDPGIWADLCQRPFWAGFLPDAVGDPARFGRIRQAPLPYASW